MKEFITLKKMKLISLGLLLMALLQSQLQAQIVSINSSTSASRVSISSTAHSQIRWSIVVAATNGGNVSLSSINGTFFAPDNSVLGTISRPLQASRNVPRAGNTTFIFQEALTIPVTVIRKAQARGFGSFFFVRQFRDLPDNTSQVSSVRFNITGGSLGGLLSIQRVAMEFDDGRITAVIPPQSEMRARALIRYTGTGLLEYSWEIASPPGTQGQPFFIPLISRKQFLLAGREVVLQSPILPTAARGQYLLRLRINKPTTAFEIPLLRYAVNTSGQMRSEVPIATINLVRPGTDSTFLNNMIFEWQPVASANAYQLEIYTRPVRDTDIPGFKKRAPVTGVIVPADKTQLTISSTTGAHLLSGENYFWRVIALTKDGKVVGRSTFRRIHIQ